MPRCNQLQSCETLGYLYILQQTIAGSFMHLMWPIVRSKTAAFYHPRMRLW